MNKFSKDSEILSLQHKLEEARYNRQDATATGCSDAVIIVLMDVEDEIISQLISLGCHCRDC